MKEKNFNVGHVRLRLPSVIKRLSGWKAALATKKVPLSSAKNISVDEIEKQIIEINELVTKFDNKKNRLSSQASNQRIQSEEERKEILKTYKEKIKIAKKKYHDIVDKAREDLQIAKKSAEDIKNKALAKNKSLLKNSIASQITLEENKIEKIHDALGIQSQKLEAVIMFSFPGDENAQLRRAILSGDEITIKKLLK